MTRAVARVDDLVLHNLTIKNNKKEDLTLKLIPCSPSVCNSLLYITLSPFLIF
jgi:hypothetical protein